MKTEHKSLLTSIRNVLNANGQTTITRECAAELVPALDAVINPPGLGMAATTLRTQVFEALAADGVEGGGRALLRTSMLLESMVHDFILTDSSAALVAASELVELIKRHHAEHKTYADVYFACERLDKLLTPPPAIPEGWHKGNELPDHPEEWCVLMLTGGVAPIIGKLNGTQWVNGSNSIIRNVSHWKYVK